MSSFFNNLAGDFSKMQQELLGPDYKYYRFINTPKELGMSSDGNMGALANDVAGLVNYTKLSTTFGSQETFILTVTFAYFIIF